MYIPRSWEFGSALAKLGNFFRYATARCHNLCWVYLRSSGARGWNATNVVSEGSQGVVARGLGGLPLVV
jgi:hypothetical protein